MTPLAKILLVVVFFAVVLGVWLAVTGSKRKLMQQRIARIHSHRTIESRHAESLRRQTSEMKGLIYWLTRPIPEFERLGILLARAGVNVAPRQYALRLLLLMLVITFGVYFLLKMPFFLGLLPGVVLGIWLPIKILQIKVAKHNKLFLQLFPDAIDLIVRGLRSGLPVSESLILVSHEVSEPVGPLFGTVANTMKLGVSLEKALQETAKRLDISEFNFFTTSILLQRETGGNLSEILNNLSEVLRARIIMRLKIKALSSEAKASTIIISALPFVVLIAVSVLSPSYIKPLFQDVSGNICLAVAAGMMGTGIYIMRRMAQFEI